MAQINIIDYNKIVYFDENTGNYKIFDGERWWLSDDKFGTSTKPSGVALVDSAIVDKSVVGEEERPAMQTIWEGTFTPIEETYEGQTYYYYNTNEDFQNVELLVDIPAVAVTFDGVTYNFIVGCDENGESVHIGSSDGKDDSIPFLFTYKRGISVFAPTKEIEIDCKDANQHTIEIKELGGRTIVPEFTVTVGQGEPGYYMYNALLFSRLPDTLDITINGTLYENVPSYVQYQGEVIYGGNPSDWTQSEYPFSIYFNKNGNVQVLAEQGGDYTIKIEGDLKEDGGSTLRVLYDGEVTGGTVEGDFIYKKALFSELGSMADYTQATITINGESKTILPVNEVQTSYPSYPNYILGMDAYPPTELSSYGVGVAVVYEVDKQTGSYVPYIITPSRSKGTQVTSLKVEVDENDKSGGGK